MHVGYWSCCPTKTARIRQLVRGSRPAHSNVLHRWLCRSNDFAVPVAHKWDNLITEATEVHFAGNGAEMKTAVVNEAHP